MRIASFDCEITETLAPNGSRWLTPELLTPSVLGIVVTDGIDTQRLHFCQPGINVNVPNSIRLESREDLRKVVRKADIIVGFNSSTFDTPLLKANGYDFDEWSQYVYVPHYDILAEYAFVKSGARNRRWDNTKGKCYLPYDPAATRKMLKDSANRISLNDLAKLNLQREKSGTGYSAPRLWQAASYLDRKAHSDFVDKQSDFMQSLEAGADALRQQVVEYCLHDCELTLDLFRRICANAGKLYDSPTEENPLPVVELAHPKLYLVARGKESGDILAARPFGDPHNVVQTFVNFHQEICTIELECIDDIDTDLLEPF